MARARNRIVQALSALVGLGVLLTGGAAAAQQTTPHLDRLEIPGGPDDGMALFRPVTHPESIFFAQMALGFSLDPLRTSNITTDRSVINASAVNVISDQLTSYATAGFEFLDRLTLAVTLPVTWAEAGNQLVTNPGAFGGGSAATTYGTSGPLVADARLDLRGVLYRTADKKAALGAQISLFAPTGNGSTTNFGGDGNTSALFMVTGEYTIKWLTLVGNTGIHFRPDNAVNDPVNNNGLGVGNEWRWAVGAFIPLKQGKFRIGGTIFGQTGLTTGGSDHTIGDTLFTARNTPVEWQGEARMNFGINGGPERWWVSGGAGTRLLNGYGAPDLRIIAMIGTYIPILDSDPASPDKKLALRKAIHDSLKDTDHDGIPDEIDPCPTVAEDHQQPDPNDGCPKPPDRDNDGIPDADDACPDVKGIPSFDKTKNGCPPDPSDTDRDKDGIPNVTDACPDVPGKPSTDPTKNGCPTFIKLEGSTVRTLKQVHFVSGSAVLAPDSYPILQEVADLLAASPGIKKMRVEGHTDSEGGAAFNLQLSNARAASVLTWLVNSGHIDAGRLVSQGFGLTVPIDTNDTPAGRANNRRVEFKIVSEEGATPQ